MAADEEAGGDLAKMLQKLKPFKQGSEVEELPEVSVESVENILKTDPKAARGANVPKDPAERARLIEEFLAKKKTPPNDKMDNKLIDSMLKGGLNEVHEDPRTLTGSMTYRTGPAKATGISMDRPGMALEQLGSKSPAKAVRASKAAPKPGPMQMSQVNQRFVNSIDEAMRHDILDPAEKTKQLYQYLKNKLPDTGTKAYGWDRKIKAIDTDIDAYLKPESFKKLTNDTSEEERQLNNWRINQLRSRYETALKEAQNILDSLTRKR